MRKRKRWLSPALRTLLFLACASALYAQEPAAANQKAEAKPVLGSCRELTIVNQEDVPLGTSLSASADGRFLALLIHTTRGGQLTLRNRATREERRLLLEPPELPPGTTWRVFGMEFSAAGDLLVARSIGKVWVISTDSAQVLYSVGYDAAKQTYPGKLSLAGSRMAISFWPVESYLADAATKQPVEVRLYDVASGRSIGSMSLPVHSSDQWTELALSPDGSRLAVLLRPTRWPGHSHLRLFNTDGGKELWDKKAGGEDLAWLGDAQQILTLGGQLRWIDAASGKRKREAKGGLRFSESQDLRVNEAWNIALGHFSRYNPFKRTLDINDRRNARVKLWRLDTGAQLCELGLDSSTTVNAWPTSQGELVALEEHYEVRASLRLLRAARVVTYRVARPVSGTAILPK